MGLTERDFCSGNYFYCGNDKVIIEGIVNDMVHYRILSSDINDDFEICDSSEFKPILLTPEIFEKAGFEYSKGNFESEDDEFYIKDNMFFHFEAIHNMFYYCDAEEGNVVKPLKYVHQLQNIFYALTGKELKIEF